jgi:galactokinase
MAIDRWVEVAGEREPGSRVVVLRSDARPEAVEIPLENADVPLGPGWGRYVAGVVRRLDLHHGFVGVVHSDLPIGAGLSSSAALEVATALAVGADSTDPLALARLCRDAEHEARGVPTGRLDQLACILGVAGHALLLDCSTYTVVPASLPPTDEAAFVVVSGARRELSRTSYTDRVDECRRAEQEIGPLRTASPDLVERIADPTLRRRARHVVSENARAREFAEALAAGQLERGGRLMDASHASLRNDFESSTPAIDALCDELRADPGVFGARITGGGWGGSVVALTRPARSPEGAGRCERSTARPSTCGNPEKSTLSAGPRRAVGRSRHVASPAIG